VSDLIYLGIVVAFFAAATALVAACDRMVGDDDVESLQS